MDYIQPFHDLPGCIDLSRNDTILDNSALPYLGLDSRPLEPVEHPSAVTGTGFSVSLERPSNIHPKVLKREQSVNGLPSFPPYPFFDNEPGSIPHTGAIFGYTMDMHPLFARQEFNSSPSWPGDSELSWASESEGGFSPTPSWCSRSIFQAVDRWEPGSGHGCGREPQSVAMQEVQNFLDIDPELQTLHETPDQKAFGPTDQDLSRYMEDMKVGIDVDAKASMKDGDTSEDIMRRISQGLGKRPTAASSHSRSRKLESNRAGKCAIRRTKTRKSTSRSALRESATKRMFVCSFAHYGCDSTFPSKNEWKRHVTSQHLQLGFYRCDADDCKPSNSKNNRCMPKNAHNNSSANGSTKSRPYNDFNRKDLFTQHQRRMHAPWVAKPDLKPTQAEEDAFEAGLENVRSRCWHENRKPPQHSQCGFCGQKFSGSRSWDERMEHVGKHFEKGERKNEAEDPDLREWALREGIIRPAGGNKWVLS